MQAGNLVVAPTHIIPFRQQSPGYISEIKWLEAPDYAGKPGYTYTLRVTLYADYSSKGLELYLQQYIHNVNKVEKPCVIKRKVYNGDDGISWITKDNDWVVARSGVITYDWLVTLPQIEPYSQYFELITLPPESKTSEFQFGIKVGK